MTTPNLQLPEIAESQASKYLTHNEALRVLDALCPNLVVQDTLSPPPGSPTDGQCWIIGPPPPAPGPATKPKSPNATAAPGTSLPPLKAGRPGISMPRRKCGSMGRRGRNA